MTENFRTKFINDGLKFCVENCEHLNDWEKQFIGNVQNIPINSWTNGRFKKLQEITESLKKRILGL